MFRPNPAIIGFSSERVSVFIRSINDTNKDWMWIWRGMYVTYIKKSCVLDVIYPLTPNDPYMGRTAPLTSKRCILYIYSTNVGTEYFKHALYSPFFSLQNAVCFIMLTCLVPVLFTFYIQGVLKLKKNNSGAKGLIWCCGSMSYCVSHRPLRVRLFKCVVCYGAHVCLDFLYKFYPKHFSY